jgi:putative membrane protein
METTTPRPWALDRGAGLLLVILAGVLLFALVGQFAMGGMMGTSGVMSPGMMWGYSAGTAAGGWVRVIAAALGMVATVAFWALLIAGGMVLFRRLAGTSSAQPSSSDTPLTILQRRYAAGEITRDEYDQMRQVLQP